MDRPLSRRSLLGLMGGGRRRGARRLPRGRRWEGARGAALALGSSAPRACGCRRVRWPRSPMMAVDPRRGRLSRWAASFPPEPSSSCRRTGARAGEIGATSRGARLRLLRLPDELYAAPNAPGARPSRAVSRGCSRPRAVAARPAAGSTTGRGASSWMYPKAELPVLELSLPTAGSARLLALGGAPSPFATGLLVSQRERRANLRRIAGEAADAVVCVSTRGSRTSVRGATSTRSRLRAEGPAPDLATRRRSTSCRCLSRRGRGGPRARCRSRHRLRGRVDLASLRPVRLTRGLPRARAARLRAGA